MPPILTISRRSGCYIEAPHISDVFIYDRHANYIMLSTITILYNNLLRVDIFISPLNIIDTPFSKYFYFLGKSPLY